MDVIEVLIETQGRVGFASREVGRTVDTENYILNTALYYALGFASGRYVDTLFHPTYVEDTEDVAEQVYVTPAAPVNPPEYWTTIYNARGDRYASINYSAQADPDQDKNLPRFGRERAFADGNLFRAFAVPKEMTTNEVLEALPTYIRLGKKRGKARIETIRRTARRESGRYTLNHPIGAYDVTTSPLGNVISKNMRPTSLIVQGDYEGAHIAIPQREKEPPVKLPAQPTFLARKR